MPFHRLNHFTGRLVKSIRLNPLTPIKPIPLQTSEIPRIQYGSLKTQAVKTAPATSTGKDMSDYARLDPKHKEYMEKIQEENMAPIFLSRGTPDKVLFGVTCVLLAIGLFESFRFIYLRANRKI